MTHAVFDVLSLSQSALPTALAPARGGLALRPLPGFDLSFAALSLPTLPGAGERQGGAGGGKILPEAGALTEQVEAAEDMDDAEAVLAWLPEGAVPTVMPEPQPGSATMVGDAPGEPASPPPALAPDTPLADAVLRLPVAGGQVDLRRAMATAPLMAIPPAFEPATDRPRASVAMLAATTATPLTNAPVGSGARADVAPDLPLMPDRPISPTTGTVATTPSGRTLAVSAPPLTPAAPVARGLVAPVQSAPAPITPPVTPVPQDAATPVEIIVPRDLATRATTDRSVAHPRDAAPMPSPTHGFDLRGAAVTPLAPAATAPATTVASAAQLFASAITGWTGPGTRGEPAPAADPGQLAQAAQATRMPVTAMSATDQAPLDLTREDWTGQMIERIATLRDSAEAADTRIKLAPENLGALDISIRRDGDRIHVHFNAENPAARQLLSEAAPRLAELAEARGVKLGQTSVDSGTGGQQDQPRQQQQATPARPVAASAQAVPEHTDHQRIA